MVIRSMPDLANPTFQLPPIIQRHGLLWFSAITITLLVLLPVSSLGVHSLLGDAQTWSRWQHLWQFVLPGALVNTAILLIGVGCLSGLLGFGGAWWVTRYEFFGRRWLAWGLMLPLGMPTYIMAYAYLDLLHPLGPLQEGIRFLLGYDNPRQWRLPDARHLMSAIGLMSLVLYPYVYMSARALLLTQGSNWIEVSQTLGAKRWQRFWRVVFPAMRPALAIGLSLVLLECLNDLGAVELMGVTTITTTVYQTWLTRGDLQGAAQMSLALLFLVVLCLAFERLGRKNYPAHSRLRPHYASRLTGVRSALAFVVVALPVVLGFILPFGYLMTTAIHRVSQQSSLPSALLMHTQNTLIIALSATALTLIAGAVIAFALRDTAAVQGLSSPGNARRVGNGSSHARSWLALSGIGYAIPGTVLAIGLLSPIARLDAQWGEWLDTDRPVILGSVFAIALALALRFLVIASGNLESGLTRIAPSIEQSARLLGATGWTLGWRIHLPLLRPSIISAGLLILVDAMKELPLTLMLRPIGMETLATWLYAEAARGVYEEGAVAACIIVLLGLIPIILIQHINRFYPHDAPRP